ncbi:MAG: carbohydrate-binding domain-containing protein [Roseburia sp.]|nr:carbohydrate-binding domain-containing protein [Roseburia sp.]
MSIKKILRALCSFALCIAMCFACIACKSRSGAPDDEYDPDYTGGEIPDENEIEITEPDATEHDFNLLSQSDGTFTYKCADCDTEETFTVTCVGGTQNAYAVAGNTLKFSDVTEDSVYDINGTLHGNLVIDISENYKFELQMSGFELSSASACPISFSSGDKVTLVAKKSTDNYIYDIRKTVSATDDNAISASVYALCDLDIQGKGSLSVKSVSNNGIHTKKDLSIKNLSLQVDCIDNALKGNDGVTVESGDVVLIARQGDGIKTMNSDLSSKGKQRGTVTVSGGDILIYAACDGIDAAYDVVIDESTAPVALQVFTDKYSKYSEEVTAVAQSVYYVRFNSTAYKYSLKFYNSDTDGVWYNSSSSTTVGNYRYFPITKPSGYTYVQLYIYNGSQQQGQGENYVARTEGMAVNNNYDTIALQSKGNSLTYGWTNYTTTQGNFGPGGIGGMGGMGGMGGNSGGMNDGNTDKGDHSTKGIKADNAVSISGGSITVSAYDDAIHANADTVLENGATPTGNVAVSGGSLTLRSNDDGIHADGKAAIGGGTISIVSSYEGIEGRTVEITNGSVSVVSSDDGINGTATSGTAITISGGKLYIYAGGDGVDSNSTTSYTGIVFSGGTSVIISTGRADSSIDTERGYKYSGGYVIGIGASGGMSSESTYCSDFNSVGTSKTVSLQKDAYLTVNDIAVIKMPVSINATVVFLGKTNASISSSTSTNFELDSNGVYWK